MNTNTLRQHKEEMNRAGAKYKRFTKLPHENSSKRLTKPYKRLAYILWRLKPIYAEFIRREYTDPIPTPEEMTEKKEAFKTCIEFWDDICLTMAETFLKEDSEFNRMSFINHCRYTAEERQLLWTFRKAHFKKGSK